MRPLGGSCASSWEWNWGFVLFQDAAFLSLAVYDTPAFKVLKKVLLDTGVVSVHGLTTSVVQDVAL